MALGYTARKRVSLLILLVALPVYVVVAVSIVNWANARWGRLPIWAELLVFVGLGILWILPFRKVFKGIGQADPDAAAPAKPKREKPEVDISTMSASALLNERASTDSGDWGGGD